MLSFRCVDPEDGGGDQTQAVRLDGRHLYPSCHLPSPFFLKCFELYSGVHLSYWERFGLFRSLHLNFDRSRTITDLVSRGNSFQSTQPRVTVSWGFSMQAVGIKNISIAVIPTGISLLRCLSSGSQVAS